MPKQKKYPNRFQVGNQVARKEINFDLLDNLIGIFCTEEECAQVLEVDRNTLESHIKKETGLSFSAYYEQKRGKGKASLRRRQFQMAEKNPALAIWLGKQYLGQVDRQELKGEGFEQIVYNIIKTYKEEQKNPETNLRTNLQTNTSI